MMSISGKRLRTTGMIDQPAGIASDPPASYDKSVSELLFSRVTSAKGNVM